MQDAQLPFALVMADLRTAATGMLERCMGRAGAAEFRARWYAESAANAENSVILPTM